MEIIRYSLVCLLQSDLKNNVHIGWLWNLESVGESERFLQHKGYVLNSHLNKTTGEHFNLKGHKVSDMRVIIVEKVFSQNPESEKKESPTI